MGLQSPVRLAPQDPGREAELAAMWRESFEFGVGVHDSHPFDEQVGQLLGQVLPTPEVRIALDGAALVGFVASTSTRIDQLYVRVGSHRRGVGTSLLDWAKKCSSGSLQLHTFARDRVARVLRTSRLRRRTAGVRTALATRRRAVPLAGSCQRLPTLMPRGCLDLGRIAAHSALLDACP